MSDYFPIPTTTTAIKDELFRVYRSKLLEYNYDPSLADDGEIAARFQAISEIALMLFLGIDQAVNDASEETASDNDLDIVADSLGLTRKEPSPSLGYVYIQSTGAVNIPKNLEASFGDVTVKVISPGVYTNGQKVRCQSLTTGTSANIKEDSEGKWSASLPNLLLTCTSSEFSGGCEAESDPELRERIRDARTNPMGGGNWEHITRIIESSSDEYQKSFVYPALNGTQTALVAICSNAQDRQVTDLNPAISVIENSLPAQSKIEVVSCVPAEIDEEIGQNCYLELKLPYTTNGNGWLDSSPWPRLPTLVDSVSVDFLTLEVYKWSGSKDPEIGTHISWYSFDSGEFINATILSVTDNGSTWEIVLDTPMTGMTNKDHICPTCIKQDEYLSTIQEYYRGLGPGEHGSDMTGRTDYRRPSIRESWSPYVDSSLTSLIQSNNAEIDSIRIRTIDDGSYYTALKPPIIGTGEAPSILTLKRVAFYPMTRVY